MAGDIHTDILHTINFPFVTLTESRMANLWYHDDSEYIFMLTATGFHLVTYTNKQVLKDRGFI